MSTAGLAEGITTGRASIELAQQWRKFTRAATIVAVLGSPVEFLYFHHQIGLSFLWSVAATAGVVIGFRGLLELVVRRFIPWPSLFGTDDARLREDDMLGRRRSWFWRRFVFWTLFISSPITIIFLFQLLKHGNPNWLDAAGIFRGWVGRQAGNPQTQQLIFSLPIFFFFNFIIFMGPMLLMGLSQIRGYEPGDADWGVKLDDVRGQEEAKEDVRRIVSLWQSGEAFEKAGGKRERGLIFHGAPGTGKTMLAKAIATGFNSPFVSIPGSGFAQTFIGIDALIVRFLARKAKKLARKWGGTCIVFIDEIDAVGMRRSSLGPGSSMTAAAMPASYHDHAFYGPWGALTPTGDLVLESRAWREKLFDLRAPESTSPYPAWARRLGSIVNQAFPGGMMGGGGMGQLALNQLLVTMDGIDNPPFWRRFWTNRFNTILDASFVVPRRFKSASLRLRPPKPRKEQIYFIGATNVQLDRLDPALLRPGRMGRHVWFRTPTKDDRRDIFNLYVEKVSHEPDLDRPERRDELARITNGYSPAMIEQVCSMALTYAHHDGRERFTWEDIIEAMTVVEAGTAINVQYIPEETRAVAIHEAGHAAAAHVHLKRAESSRLSIRMRGGALGHHQALEKEERFSSWQDEEIARLVWTLGAMAAERVFYDKTTTGVGGDIQSATGRAAWMVGACGMAPDPLDLPQGFADENAEDTRERIMKRFERIGLQIMNRTGGGGMFDHDPISGVLSDRDKRAMAAQILGQAYVQAYNLIVENKEAVSGIADALVERREILGDELLETLNRANLRKPDIDLTNEVSWPRM